MRIVWISSPSELETDIIRSAEAAGIDCYMYWILGKSDSKEIFSSKNFRHVRVAPASRMHEVVKEIIEINPDLCVARYPTWSNAGELCKIPNLVLWLSEQGPTRDHSFITGILRLPCINLGVNNLVDVEYFKNKCPDKRVLYLPFGCYSWKDEDLQPNAEYVSDLIADGGAHYACHCCTPSWKRQSVETMVLPVINRNIALYGSAGSDNIHGWKHMPGGTEKWRSNWGSGRHAVVYSSAKLYLGINWSWSFGGYGSKLSRALSTGIPVLWHKTVGMEKEFEKGNQLDWSSTPKETVERVDYYLTHDKERIAMGQRGRQYAQEHLDWGKNLTKLAQKIKK